MFEGTQYRDHVRTAAGGDVATLLTGETGAGKDFYAQWIHANSPRREAPFVMINCAAITESLFESELFGHEKGAFTGAVARTRGDLYEANNGTLFLNEIAELPRTMQAKLLDVAETKQYAPVGSTIRQRSNFRLICATNQPLNTLQDGASLRRDLYYRINELHIHIPPLRERKEEVLPLARTFAAALQPKRELADETIDFLLCYGYPGNVRELRHAVEHAVMNAGQETILRREHFPAAMLNHCTHLHDSPSLDEIETCHGKHVLLEMIKACGGNKAEAARRLQISRKTLYERLNALPKCKRDT